MTIVKQHTRTNKSGRTSEVRAHNRTSSVSGTIPKRKDMFRVIPRKSSPTEKIFILDSASAFKKAEAFKSRLENKGFSVVTESYGFNDVRIKGVKKPLELWCNKDDVRKKRFLAFDESGKEYRVGGGRSGWSLSKKDRDNLEDGDDVDVFRNLMMEKAVIHPINESGWFPKWKRKEV